MPTLPTITVTQEQFDRLVASFPGADLAAKSDAYKAWLTNQLIDRVERVEVAAAQQESNALLVTKLETLRASLPPRAEYPPAKASPPAFAPGAP